MHEVHAGQIFVAGEHARSVFSFDAHEVRQSRTGSDEDAAIALRFQFVHRDGLTHDAVRDKFHALRFQTVDFSVHHRAGQTEFGNTVAQHTARGVKCFKDRDGISPSCHFSGEGKSRGTAADHRNLTLLRSGGSLRGSLGSVLTSIVRSKAFQIADGNRL